MKKGIVSRLVTMFLVGTKLVSGSPAFAQPNVLAWEQTVADGSVEAYVNFVFEYVDSEFVDEAICRIAAVDEPLGEVTALQAAAIEGGTGTGATWDHCKDVEYAGNLNVVLATDTFGRMFNI
jgi:hypothetical protein